MSFWEPWKGPICVGLAFEVAVINDSRLFHSFQPSVVFHIETLIWFTLQIMPNAYMEFYTSLKQVKNYWVCQDVSKEVLLLRPKI